MVVTDLYRFFDASDRLLYIGISLHAAHRASEHRRDKPWWPDVARMTIERVPGDRSEALSRERAAILTERPLHNVAHNSQATELSPHTQEEPTMAHPLIGKFVLTPDLAVGWPLAHYQGHVTGQVNENHFLVQWFSWWSGERNYHSVVNVADMAGWRFWDDQEEFITAADKARDARPEAA